MESASESSKEELKLLLAAKDATIAAQGALIEELAARVEELERRLDKDSSNSSRPPSSDLPFAKPAPKRSSRTLSGKCRGKQDGALGTTLRLVDNPDETVRREPVACGGCGASLSGASMFDERRHQVCDVPPAPPRPRVTE
nr:DUF6444 domain-containing protein [Streptomyces sp. NBC_00830]